MQLRVPAMAIGRIGTRDSMASWKAPSLNGSSSSVRERVPSGKIITLTRRARRSRHSASAAMPLSRCPRCTGTSSAMRIIQPITGILKIVCLESHFISHGKWRDEEDVGVRFVVGDDDVGAARAFGGRAFRLEVPESD